jgi:hypothetical protein
MAFDRTDPADLAALKSEVETDPIAMGYAAVVGNTSQLLKLLNDPSNNVGGEAAARVFTPAAMLDALDPTELDANNTEGAAPQYTVALIAHYQTELDIASYKQKWRAMFAANSATVAALDAQTQALSRAEVLFGQGTVITKNDWFAARDS